MPFHGRGRKGKRHLQRRFLRKRGAGGGRSLPLGGAVAQRLRGFKSAEPEKTVKRSSRRTGVNLQFFSGVALCFGVKRGEQPLFRGSSASKSLALFWFSFGVKREHPSTNKSFPVKPQSIRSRQRLHPRGSWQNRQVLTEGVKFPLPCNDSPRSTVCSMEKVSKFCPAAEGRMAGRLPVLGRKNCAFCRF